MMGQFIAWLIYGGIALVVIVAGIGIMERRTKHESLHCRKDNR